MNPEDFFLESTTPEAVSLAAQVINDWHDRPGAPCVDVASDLLQEHLASELRAEQAIYQLRRGVAEEIAEVSLDLPNMTDEEIGLETDRLMLLAKLMAAAKAALGRKDGMLYDDENDDEREQEAEISDGNDSDGEGQAIPWD